MDKDKSELPIHNLVDDLKTKIMVAVMHGPMNELMDRINKVFSDFEQKLITAIDDEAVKRGKQYFDGFKDSLK